METNKATVTFFYDTRREKKDALYPVKINVYFDGEKKRYKTGVDISKVDWKKINGTNLRDDDLKTIKRKLNLKKGEVEAIIDEMSSFTFSAFEEHYYREKKVRRTSDLEELFNEYIDELNRKGNVGTAISYNTTKNSIIAFRPKLKVTDITTKFLEEYETYMLSKGHASSTKKVKEKAGPSKVAKKISPTTIGIYLRQLRRIVNVAITKGLMSADKYPFKGFTMPNSRNIKKALTGQQVKLLFDYQTDNPQIRQALDFWLFSYLSNGINMTDVCHLKPANIGGDFFHYYRAKTKNTKKRDLRPIKVPLTERSKAIIKAWKNTNPHNSYLFPILEDELTPKQAKYRIQDFIAKINKHMKTVAAEVGIEEGIGTYVARHSHATILKRKGAPSEVIKENLGHSSLLTTENYLGDFTDDVKKDYANMLTDW